MGPQTLDKVEVELAHLVTHPDHELQTPVSPQKWWLGGELALIQLVSTWARLSPNSTLITHIGPEVQEDRQLKALSKRVFGFVTLLLANEILDRARTPDRSLKSVAYVRCAEIAKRMHGPISKFAMGAKVFLISVDHSSLWAIPWLYTPSGEVLDRTSFTNLARELVAKLSPHMVRDPIPDHLFPQFGAILHELFKNTDEWGKKDVDKRPFRRSVRGLTVERHRLHKDTLPLPNGFPAFGKFFAACPSTDGFHRFLEFSVFDSGVGLARQWLKSEWSTSIPIEKELEACLNCLRKNNTSSHQRTKGLGLAEVLKTLNELGAFLYLRTGRLSLYRDFRTMPLEDESDFRIFDLTNESTVPTERALAAGACFQILIPLAEKF